MQLIGEGLDGALIDVRSLEPRRWVKLTYNWFKNKNPHRIGILSRPERLKGIVPPKMIKQMDQNPIFHFYTRPQSTIEAAKITLDFLRLF